MSSDSGFSHELRKELLDDFYAECDELLTAIKASLAVLERCAEKNEIDDGNTESLFRYVHTLKGISTIVGLRPVEEIAHAVEEVLRRLTKQELTLRPPDVDTLVAAVHGLEQTVNSHRQGRDGPDIRPLLVTLRRIASSGAARAKGSGKKKSTATHEPVSDARPAAQAARERGLHLYLFTFTPSPALDQQGMNVNAVRQRLSGLGEILSATPVVREKGAITFEFQVALREKPADLEGLKEQGILCTALPEEAADTGESAPAPLHSEELPMASAQTVRVDLARLDDLMRITGEMIVHRFRLEDRLAQKELAIGDLNEISLAMGRSLREMRGAISRARLVPIAEIFARIPFVVRDLSRGSAKKARVTLEGSQTEIDKYLVERLKEPLLHLVRNAFSHGVENPAERLAAGKPAEANIRLTATSEGEHVMIHVRDDGRGIDPVDLAARAQSQDLVVPPQLDAGGMLELLCTPGFSTRDEADLASGRGVGMAIVANTVRELGGTLALDSTPGEGTRFILRFPLTLSIAEAIIVAVGTTLCAVPQSFVEEIVQVPSNEMRSINRSEVVPYRGGLLPIVRLRTVFRLESEPAELCTFLVIRGERGITGLVVDRVQGQREVVIRPLIDPLVRVPGVSGATELGDGQPILILDPIAITNGVVRTLENVTSSAQSLATNPRAS